MYKDTFFQFSERENYERKKYGTMKKPNKLKYSLFIYLSFLCFCPLHQKFVDLSRGFCSIFTSFEVINCFIFLSLSCRLVPSGRTWFLAASRATTSLCCCCTPTRGGRRCRSRTCPRASTSTTSTRPVTTAKTRVTTTQLGVVVVAQQQTFR